MFDTWTPAVFSLMNSASAIWRLVRPSATSAEHLPLAAGEAERVGRRWTAPAAGGEARRCASRPIRARRASDSRTSAQRPGAELRAVASEPAKDVRRRRPVARLEQRLGFAPAGVGGRVRPAVRRPPLARKAPGGRIGRAGEAGVARRRPSPPPRASPGPVRRAGPRGPRRRSPREPRGWPRHAGTASAATAASRRSRPSTARSAAALRAEPVEPERYQGHSAPASRSRPASASRAPSAGSALPQRELGPREVEVAAELALDRRALEQLRERIELGRREVEVAPGDDSGTQRLRP